MSLVVSNKYVAASVENPGVDVTKEYNLYTGAVESITIGDASAAQYTYTVAASADRQLYPYNLVKIAVTNGHFTVDAVLTISKQFRLVGDRVQFVFTPSDIPAGRSIVIKDDASSPNTLDTLTSTSDASRSTSTRSFVLNSDGTWTKVGDVPNSTGAITSNSIKLSGGSTVTKFLVGTKTYDAASITAPNTTSTTVTVTGAAAGDYVIATLTTLTTAAQLTAYVSGADTVTVVVGAYTGTVDLASGTLNVLVVKAS